MYSDQGTSRPPTFAEANPDEREYSTQYAPRYSPETLPSPKPRLPPKHTLSRDAQAAAIDGYGSYGPITNGPATHYTTTRDYDEPHPKRPLIWLPSPHPSVAPAAPPPSDYSYDGFSDTSQLSAPTGDFEPSLVQPSPDSVLLASTQSTPLPERSHMTNASSSSSSSSGGDQSSTQGVTPPAQMISTFPTASKQARADDRRQRRLLRNRIAAKECRRKKKQYIQGLEDQIECLSEELAKARKELEEANAKLTLGSLRGPPPAVTPSPHFAGSIASPDSTASNTTARHSIHTNGSDVSSNG
ncbi:hypothetical protein H4R34_001488 [Dimargaris verticillata]|uniref:BZIP domain-containing protein n=1 Tax=Dimargaris verticillata TaxID=2761393 RepID=A0A9W8BB99_9FUNG|nr:hypothetical protein H4R34_001488 [Dimargaris verticillata]